MTLVPCPSCQRHVEGAAARCPFCEAALTPSDAVVVEEPPPADVYGSPAWFGLEDERPGPVNRPQDDDSATSQD